MKKGRLLANAYLVLVFGFLYVPIAVLIAFSFNESKSRTVFTGFTFKWYQNLFHNDMVLKSLGVSLGVAFAAACIATVVGTKAMRPGPAIAGGSYSRSTWHTACPGTPMLATAAPCRRCPRWSAWPRRG